MKEIENNLSFGADVVGGFVKGATNNLMRRDQYGRAVGSGAFWIDRHIRARTVRMILGWNQQSPEEIADGLNKREGNYQITPIPKNP